MNLPEFSVNRRIAISMVICIIVLFGGISFFDLGLDLLPNLEYPFVSVVTTYEGVGTSEIEMHVTRPIEEAVSMVKNVRTVYSISQEGISTVIIKFEWGTDLGVAAQDVRDKLSYLSDILPSDADPPKVIKYNTADMPVIFYAVSGLENTSALRDYIRDDIETPIKRLDGVAAVYPMGGLRREINVTVDREKLQGYGLSLEYLRRVIAAENLNLSGGHVTQQGMEYLVRTEGEFDSIDQIRDMVVANVKGRPVHLRDVANVSDTFKEVRSVARVNGKDCVLLAILKEAGANTVAVVDRVKKTLQRLKPKMPPSVKFEAMMDQADFIKKAIVGTAMNVLQGAILAVGMIFVFLRSFRPTLIISIAIPLSIITTFIGMDAAGYTFNIMTLGGLALGIGMLVDNAIVVIENTFRHLEEAKQPKLAAKLGASEVSMAITASTLTTVAVFAPIAFAKGIAGKLSKPLGLTVCLALFASLFVALTIVPMLSSIVLKPIARAVKRRRFGLGSFERVVRQYRRGLLWALHHRKTVLLVAGAAFALSVFALRYVGMEFMPTQDVPMMLFFLRMPPGTPLERTDATVAQIENVMRSQPEVESIGSFIGLSEATKYDVAAGFGAAAVNEAEIMVTLWPKAKRRRTSNQVTESIRKLVTIPAGATFEAVDMGQQMSGALAGKAPVEIKVFGKDMDRLNGLVGVIKRECLRVKGLRDIESTFKEGNPELRIEVDRQKASQLGLSVLSVANSVKQAMLGVVASRYRVGGDEFDIRLRLEHHDRDSEQDVEQIPVRSPLGFTVPLYQIASISRRVGPIKIYREDQERKITLKATTFGRDIGSIVGELKKRLSNLRLPSGYSVEFGGAYEEMVESFRVLIGALVVAVLLIFMVMAAQFESLLQPFIIMFTIPLGIIGVVIGLVVTRTTLSVPAIMGTIILLGVVVNNGIVMIDYVNQLRRRGISPQEALVTGATVRLRPILITTATTVLGILPVAFSTSEGAEIRSPMGIAIAFGLSFATFLTLFVIPTVYSIVERISFRQNSRTR